MLSVRSICSNDVGRSSSKKLASKVFERSARKKSMDSNEVYGHARPDTAMRLKTEKDNFEGN